MEVNKLKLAKADYLSTIYDMEDRVIHYYPLKIKSIEARLSTLKEDICTIHDNKEFCGMTIMGKEYREKEQAGQALLWACKEMTSFDPVEIGTYRGFKLELVMDQGCTFHKAILHNHSSYQVDLGTDAQGNITRLNNKIDSLPKDYEIDLDLLQETKKQLVHAQTEIKKPFAKEEQLKAATRKLSQLNKELSINKQNDIPIVADERELLEEKPKQYER